MDADRKARYGRILWCGFEARRCSRCLLRRRLSLASRHAPGRHGVLRRHGRVQQGDPLHREHAVPLAVRQGPRALPRTSGIGCISDTDPQPLLVRSHHGTFAVTTVGAINNADELIDEYFERGGAQFMAMSSGAVNHTELVAALINQKDDLVEGILYAQRAIKGSLTLLVMTEDGVIYAARDPRGPPAGDHRARRERRRLLRLARELRLSQAGLPGRIRARLRRGRAHHARGLRERGAGERRHEDLRVSVGVLRVPPIPTTRA